MENNTNNQSNMGQPMPQQTPQGQPSPVSQQRPAGQPRPQKPQRASGLPDPNKPVPKPTRQQASVPLQRRPQAQQQPVEQPQEQPVAQPQEQQPAPPKKKKGKGKFIALGLAVVVVGGVVAGAYVKSRNKEEPPKAEIIYPVYEETGRYPIDNVISAVQQYNAETLNTLIPNSWLAQEWEYANSDEIRENFIKSICSYVEVSYPQKQLQDTLGGMVVNTDGSAMMDLSSMLDGEALTLTIVDYEALAATMQEDIALITDMYNNSGYKITDYEYTYYMTNLMLDYLLEKAQFPTKQVNVTVQVGEMPVEEEVSEGSEGSEDDENVDSSVSEEALDASGMVYNGEALVVTPLNYTAEAIVPIYEEPMTKPNDGAVTKSESSEAPAIIDDSEYTITIAPQAETVTNPDGSQTSVTRYHLVDDSGLDQLIFSSEDFHNMLDTYGSLIAKIEYDKEDAEIAKLKEEHDQKVKDSEDKLKKMKEKKKKELEEEGMEEKEIKEELKKVKLSDKDKVAEWVEPERQFSATYVPESVIPYTWLGSYFSQNIYEGESNKVAQVGDGSFELPAGLGTTVVTKGYCTDGKFHDIKVTLLSYYLGENAIDYAISFSEKNRGFDPTSQVKLICYEVQIENLENEPIELASDMFLSDQNSNQSARTGNMYGFFSDAVIEPHQSIVLNDWATSTEMNQKYVCWGRSFDRQHPVVWFKLLAGSGEEVPEYNANTSYVNKEDFESKEETTEEAEEANSTTEA